MGSSRGGGQGSMPPPPQKLLRGGSNAFAPPPRFKDTITVMYTINVQCFSLKKNPITMECMHKSVHCTMLFSTELLQYTHARILTNWLVAHYTGNRQSTV